jgi:membrane protease YdiL (CAAX protease family)
MDPVVTPNETTVSAPEPAWPRIAPLWHTLILVVVVLAFSALGAISEHPVAKTGGRIPQYLLTMAWEWILFVFVIWGAKKSGTSLRTLIGGRWEHFEDFLLDIAIALGFWIISAAVLVAIAFAVGMANPSQIKEAQKQLEFLLPQSTLEMTIAILLSVTAGFCEEVIFRGYLQRQMASLARNAWAGIVLSGIFFGCAHGYEGWRRMIMIAVYGMLFGLLAHFRRSLRPGMMTHAVHDSTAMIVPHFLKGVKMLL